jgi:hypothetical protein
MAKRKHPSKEKNADLQKVFDKHNWFGAPIGIVAPQGLTEGAPDDDCP